MPGTRDSQQQDNTGNPNRSADPKRGDQQQYGDKDRMKAKQPPQQDNRGAQNNNPSSKH